jgi:hypothetical protein
VSRSQRARAIAFGERTVVTPARRKRLTTRWHSRRVQQASAELAARDAL